MSGNSPPVPPPFLAFQQHSSQNAAQCTCPVHGNASQYGGNHLNNFSTSSQNTSGQDLQPSSLEESFNSSDTWEDLVSFLEDPTWTNDCNALAEDHAISPAWQTQTATADHFAYHHSRTSSPNDMSKGDGPMSADATGGGSPQPRICARCNACGTSRVIESYQTTTNGVPKPLAMSSTTQLQARERIMNQQVRTATSHSTNSQTKLYLPRLTRSKVKPREEKRKHPCTEAPCTKTFSRVADLRRHVSDVHQKSNRYYECDQDKCARWTIRRDKIKDHCRKAHKLDKGSETFSVHYKDSSEG